MIQSNIEQHNNISHLLFLLRSSIHGMTSISFQILPELNPENPSIAQ